MAKNDNLGDFLLDIADAIRTKKGYVEGVLTSFSDIDTLVYQKTGRHLDSDSSIYHVWPMMSIWSGSQFIMITTEDSNDDQFLIIFFGRQAADTSVNKDVYLSDLVLTTNANNEIIYENVSTATSFYIYRFQIINNLWSEWNPTTLFQCTPGQSGNMTTSTLNAARIVVQPFVNVNDVSLPAQNFSSEILSISDGYFGKLVYDGTTQVDSGTSVVPPPYDQDGYNYNDSAPVCTDSETITVSEDLTGYTTMKILWDDVGSGNGYGEIYSSATIDSVTQMLYRLGHAPSYQSGVTIYDGIIVSTIDITSVTGVQNVVISNYAFSASAYRGNSSCAITNVYKIYVS